MSHSDERIRAWYRALPAKRIGAGALFTDDQGRVLLVQPTYKDSWEVPGGMVEEAESPHEAAAREIKEELGFELRRGRLLCVDWVPARDPKTDGLMFVFDGGGLEADDVARITLPPEELSEYRFVDPEMLASLLPERIARRLIAGLAARDADTTHYLVDGRLLDHG